MEWTWQWKGVLKKNTLSTAISTSQVSIQFYVPDKAVNNSDKGA